MPTIVAIAADADERRRLVDALLGCRGARLVLTATIPEALEQLSQHPAELVVLGDSAQDIVAAPLAQLRIHGGCLVVDGEDIARLSRAGRRRSDVAGRSPVEAREWIAEVVRRLAPQSGLDVLETLSIEAGIHLEFQLGNDKTQIPEAVDLLIRAAFRAGWLRDEDRLRCSIALEEALVNAVVHGNLEVSSMLREREDDAYETLVEVRRRHPHYARRRVRLTLEADERRAVWTVADQGPGFDTSRLPDPRDPKRLLLSSGRGVLLMRTFMDEVRYNARGNCVQLEKLREAAHPAAEVLSEAAAR